MEWHFQRYINFKNHFSPSKRRQVKVVLPVAPEMDLLCHTPIPPEMMENKPQIQNHPTPGLPESILKPFLPPSVQAGSGAGRFSFPEPGAGMWNRKNPNAQGLECQGSVSGVTWPVTISRDEPLGALEQRDRGWPCHPSPNHSPKSPHLTDGSGRRFSLDKIN